MTDIEKLFEYADEEIEDACKYAKCAVAHKNTDAKLGDMYYMLAKEELHHEELEQEQIERLLSEDEDSGHEWWKLVWNWEKNKLVDRKANINAMLTMYKA